MSLDITTQVEEACDGLQLNAFYELRDHILAEKPEEFTLDSIKELRDLDMNPAAAVSVLITRNHFATRKTKFLSGMEDALRRYGHLTEKQLLTCLNIFRERALDIPSKFAKKDPASTESSGSSSTTTGDDGADVPVLAGAKATGLDISGIPDGYYGVYLPNSKGTSEMTFLQIKRLRKNKTLRTSHYRYSKIMSGHEYVPAGTIEVRELFSDSKRLAGEQRFVRAGELYRGEFEKHLWIIMLDPELAAKTYATEIGRCGRCGKKLTDDISRSDGFGPECIHHVNAHFHTKDWSKEFADKAKTTCPTPGCKRTDGHLAPGEDELYVCGSGHYWVVEA